MELLQHVQGGKRSWLRDAERRLDHPDSQGALDLFQPTRPDRDNRRSSMYEGTPGTGRLADYLHHRTQVGERAGGTRDAIISKRSRLIIFVVGMTLISVLYRYLILERSI